MSRLACSGVVTVRGIAAGGICAVDHYVLWITISYNIDLKRQIYLNCCFISLECEEGLDILLHCTFYERHVFNFVWLFSIALIAGRWAIYKSMPLST
jgi:hypothetical protein